MKVSDEARRAKLEGRLHLVLAGVWLVLAVPTLLWWRDSILWVLMISLYANIASHWGAYQGARAARVGAENPPPTR